jgi:GNAT superfamily N-acetyltransferase
MQIIRVTDSAREVVEPQWLSRAEVVHRQLRPHLPQDYAKRMREVFRAGGEMCVAVQGDAVAGVAVYRLYENTFSGTKLYVDDLVTDERLRSRGVGHALIAFLEEEGRRRGADALELDSGTHRTRAHRFYFREGFVISSFLFRKDLK